MFQSVSIFSLYNPLFQCFETPDWGLVFSPFFRACFNFVSKRFKTTETFVLKSNVSVFSLYNPLFQCFETPEMGPGGLSQFSSCFSLFQFFPYIIHCFSVSKHQKWGLIFSPFSELVSILFRNISKQLKRLDLVNFLHVSVRFNFFPI